MRLSFSLFLSLLLSGLSLSVYAGADFKAKLIVPEALNVMYLNGKKKSRSLFESGDQTLEVGVGPQQLVVEYEEIWEDGDDHDRVISEPVMITFNVEAGQSYRIKIPRLTNVKAAKAYAKLPNMTVVNHASNKKIEAELSYQLEQQTFLESFVKKKQPVFQKPVVDSQGKATDKAGSKAADKAAVLKQLKALWQNASEAERAAFLKWAK